MKKMIVLAGVVCTCLLAHSCSHDTDGDGNPDVTDLCPFDSNKTEPGECGCGVPEGSCDDPNQSPVVRFSQPHETASSNLAVIVDATDPDGEVVEVLLYINNSFVRRETQAPYEWGTANTNNEDAALLNLSPGAYQLRAEAIDNKGAKATETLSVTVVEQNTECDQNSTSAGCHVIVPSQTSDDADIIQVALDGLIAGDTLLLVGDFVIGRTIYLPSEFTWILDGTLTLGDNADLDRIGIVEPGINSTKYTAITEVPGGASNIDMSGGTYFGNAENNIPDGKGVRLINFIDLQNSYFHDMVIENASDDNFTLGARCSHNEVRNLVSRDAGANEELSGNGLTDRGDYNKWYDCIAEDCLSDGWTPKCRHSEFHRCIARRNLGPGFGLYARLDGSPQSDSQGQAIEGNRFYACESYDNHRGGFSLDISSNCPGGIVRDNFIQGIFYNNRMTGVLFRNKQTDGIMDNNEVDIVSFGNLGETATPGNASSLGAGLGVDGRDDCPITKIHGSIVAYDNGGGDDIDLADCHNCTITVYNPQDGPAAEVDQGDGNSVNTMNFSCPASVDLWSLDAYCEVNEP